ncbi:hypothetical protein B0O99DRAFT_696121 [Bisporella sp. PMI_857]|nr:hypothetical protein B0O99DRAFT_696121 [Bisporella sp. PMI_857]
MAFSLELGSYPITNESEVKGTQDYSLVLEEAEKGKKRPFRGISEFATGTADVPANLNELKQYQFPLQVGDRQRSFDGIIGIWKTKDDAAAKKTGGGLNSSFDYSTLHTFWPDDNSPPILQTITPQTMSLAAFYTAPDKLVDGSYILISPNEQAQQRNSHLQVISALIDPFAAVHAYTGILPTVSLTLPHWITEQALQQMTTDFSQESGRAGRNG